MRRTMRVIGRGAVMLLLALVLAELALQGAAFLVQGGGAAHKILSLEIARDVMRVVVGGPLTELTFDGDERRDGVVFSGTCSRTTTGCESGSGCYRWNPQGTPCNVQLALIGTSRIPLRVSARLRVSAFPSGVGGSDVLSLIEGNYGTGIYVQFTNRNQLRVFTVGSGGREGTCLLATHLLPDVWYELRVRASKSDHARATLELRTSEGEVIDTISCTDLPAGGGTFTHLTIGSRSPDGATADVTVDDVAVYEERS